MEKTKKKLLTVEEIIKSVDKNLEEGLLVIPRIANKTIGEKEEVVSTGSDKINEMLDIGGLPFGRIVEIMGEEASGKSTLCFHIIAEAQRIGVECAYIDTEHSFDRKRAEQIGINFDNLAISQPMHAEQALDLLDYLVNNGRFKVIILDSVAALVPKAELEGGMGDAVIGVQARLMGKALRKITGLAKQNKVLVIFTNQLRDKIGSYGLPVKVGSGGNALKFYASIRIDMRRTKNEIRREKLVYTHHKVSIKKNKLGVPFRVGGIKIGEKGFINDNPEESEEEGVETV